MAEITNSNENVPPLPTEGQWEAFKSSGNTYFRNGKFDEAINQYTQAIELTNGSEPSLYSNRAAAYLSKKMYRRAIEDAEKALVLDPFFLKSISRLTQGQMYSGDFIGCTKSIEKYISLIRTATETRRMDPQGGGNKSTPELTAEMATSFIVAIKELSESMRQAQRSQRIIEDARELLNSGKHVQAAASVRPLALQYPDAMNVVGLYAEALAPSDAENATRLLAPFALTYDDDTTYLYARAVVSYYRGPTGLKDALVLLRRCLSFDPDFKPAQVLRKSVSTLDTNREAGNTCFRERNYQKAIEHYTDAIVIAGGNRVMLAVLYGNRSAAHLEMKNWELALSDVQAAIDLSGTNPQPKLFARRSTINEQLGKFEEAIRDMKSAAENDRNYMHAAREVQTRCKRAMRKDFYKILDVPQTASSADIKKAYKRQALQWHPDKWAHDTEENRSIAEQKFKDLGEALAILSDPRKKKLYDTGRIDNDTEGDMASASQGFGMGPNDAGSMFSNFFTYSGGRGKSTVVFSFS